MKKRAGRSGKTRLTLPILARIGLIIATVLLFTMTLVVISSASGASVPGYRPVAAIRVDEQPPDAQSTTGPIPPAGIDAEGLTSDGNVSAMVTLQDVPAYLWHHGCGPTAAGMVIGYWDGHGFDDLVAGNSYTQTAAVNKMIASEGPASNYTDYCEPIDYAPNLFPDLSEDPPGDEHPNECLADHMKTSQSRVSNRYGWSWFSDVGIALEGYSQQALHPDNYRVSTRDLYQWDGSLNWNSFRAEIDAGRPMVLLVDTDGNGGTDHFVTAISYAVIDGENYYGCLNTWDSDVHWYRFGPMAQGQPWGIFGGVTYEVRTYHRYFLVHSFHG